MSTSAPEPRSSFPWDGFGPESPIHFTAHDATVPQTDAAAVGSIRNGRGDALVSLYGVMRDPRSGQDFGSAVNLTPADARRFAAAILDAADAADGTTPLVFLPRQPDEPKPRPS